VLWRRRLGRSIDRRRHQMDDSFVNRVLTGNALVLTGDRGPVARG
jgi:hypothetical protein